MPVTATTVEIARGLTMPFLPMRSDIGDPLHTAVQIKSALEKLEDDEVVIQPALNGKRVCLAVVDRNIFIQDEAGQWVSRPPLNGHDFLKLPNNTCLDGYILHNNFYSGDCLSVRGQTLLIKSAAEREAVAFQLTKFLGHQWLFRRPSAKFIRAAKQNLPDFQGLTLKDYLSLYVLLSTKSSTSKQWLKRLW